MRFYKLFLVIFLGLAVAAGGAHAQEQKKGGFFGLFNGSGQADSASKPIFMGGTAAQGYQQPAGQYVQPYQPGGSQNTAGKGGQSDPFAAAMAGTDAANQANSDIASAVRQDQTNKMLEAERARMAQFKHLQSGPMGGPAEEEPGKDKRKMVYEKKDKKPGTPARLFNTNSTRGE